MIAKKQHSARAHPGYIVWDPRLLNWQEPQRSLDPAVPLSSNSVNVNRCCMKKEAPGQRSLGNPGLDHFKQVLLLCK